MSKELNSHCKLLVSKHQQQIFFIYSEATIGVICNLERKAIKNHQITTFHYYNYPSRVSQVFYKDTQCKWPSPTDSYFSCENHVYVLMNRIFFFNKTKEVKHHACMSCHRFLSSFCESLLFFLRFFGFCSLCNFQQFFS